jgi:hypothetical protein
MCSPAEDTQVTGGVATAQSTSEAPNATLACSAQVTALYAVDVLNVEGGLEPDTGCAP